MKRTRTTQRRGFTLVELMVAAAVSVIIMTILAYVFQQALESMRTVRSQAEMADQLRAVGNVIQKDLGRDGGICFLPDETNASNYGVRTSDWPGSISPTQGGYMMISSSPSTIEGVDGNGFLSSVATNHSLQFTSVLPGLLEKDNYTAVVAGQTFTSPAAEIAYFLAPSGQFLPNGSPLYNLHRRQWLIAKTTADITRLNNALLLDPVNGPNVISAPGGAVNIMPGVQGNPSIATSIATGTGEDILLSNVLSFEVKVNSTYSSPASVNSDYPFDNLTTLPSATYNSSSTPSAALPVVVRGVQIRIRVYDPKVQAGRQMTIVQDL